MEDESAKLSIVKKATVIGVDFVEEDFWSFSSRFENVGHLIDFSWKNISALSEINVKESFLNGAPVNPSFFLVIQIYEKSVDFMTRDVGTDLSDQLSQCSHA